MGKTHIFFKNHPSNLLKVRCETSRSDQKGKRRMVLKLNFYQIQNKDKKAGAIYGKQVRQTNKNVSVKSPILGALLVSHHSSMKVNRKEERSSL
jgi:hypothetical protein